MNLNINKGMYLEKVIDQTVQFYYTKPYFFFMKYHTKNSITKQQHFLYIENNFVDYFGYYKNHFFAIEAKQNATDRFSLNRLNNKQWFVLNKLDAMNVPAFVLLYFTKYDEFYLLNFKVLQNYFENNKKSIKYSEIKKEGIALKLILLGILNLKNIFDELWD